jgi:hypothetical protein
MDSEIKAIHDNHTWTLVPRTLYTSVIFAHWFYKVKPGINGLGEKLKVRWVVRGFQQQLGIDYDDTFAPIVMWSTICYLVVIAAHHGWKIWHWDIIIAFLHGDLIE